MAARLGLIETIDTDDEVKFDDDSSEGENETQSIKNRKKKIKKHKDFNDDFEFYLSDADEKSSEKTEKVTEKKKVPKKEKAEDANTNTLTLDDDEDGDKVYSSDAIRDKMSKKTRGKKDKEDKQEETIDYAEVVTSFETGDGFKDMELSRPLLKALTAMGWIKPTPIQAAVIPKGLMGHDLCACAATGTGKTGAFMIPIIERLIYKPNKTPITRVLVLTPTRELALQIYDVSRQLAQFTKITISQSAGGTDRKVQEAALRLGPDIVIATLGRLIDHLQNAPSFNLNNVEILVLDEADRMLDEFFAEQMKEVIARCNPTRQTLLFSATMTEKVEDLATVSLKRPIKVFVNENVDVALNLQQEFVRIRPQREDDREAIIAALVKRFFKEDCILFIKTKKQAHRIRLILNLLGIEAGELHGDLKQPERLETLQKFKDGELDVLVATDLLARGLDIPDVKTVINMDMPPSVERYIHRVGRTARAGKSGLSVTLFGENDRIQLRTIAKRANHSIKLRTISKEIVGEFKMKIDQLEDDLKALEKQEKAEKELRITELQLTKAQTMLEKGSETTAKGQKRKWFQTRQERTTEKERLKKLTKNDTGNEEKPTAKSKKSKLR